MNLSANDQSTLNKIQKEFDEMVGEKEIEIMTSCDCGGSCPDCSEALNKLTQK